MNAIPRNIITAAIVAVTTVLVADRADAQAVKVSAESPSFDTLLSPEFSGGKQKAFRAKNWLEMETKIRVAMSPEPASKTSDRLTIKWYVAIENPERRGHLLLLTRDVEHVNIPLGEDVYCSIYLSPASIKRITGSDRASKRSIEAVGFEILVNGVKVAEDTSKFRVGWWSAASDKISRSDAVPLLSKNETPFSSMWWDRYAEVLDPRVSR